MNFKILASADTNVCVSKFWCSIKIWINRPHLINKRIASSEIILIGKFNTDDIDSIIKQITNIEHTSQFILENFQKNVEVTCSLKLTILPINTNFITNIVDKINEKLVYVIVSRLFPKDSSKFSSTILFTLIDKKAKNITCYSKCLDVDKRSLDLQWPYNINYNNGNISLAVTASQENMSHPSIYWLKTKFFSSLKKWVISDIQHNKSLVEGSLNLISVRKYFDLYNNLKKKYSDSLIKNWTECTDPKKYVFEDIAIAAYLMVLWEQEKNENHLIYKQSFLDLGCGNGLLTYILTSEGHNGLGIDLRRRKIWEFFSQTAQLEEKTIIPSSKSLFPDTDWIIGNHSDELTPWIPVITARSSYKCRFFLLPCCAYEFDGRKYQRSSADNSQYLDYLKYVKSICDGCGFITKLDKLRIPSTKRTCFIGLNRSYDQVKTDLIDDEIEKIIVARSVDLTSGSQCDTVKEGKWSQNFQPREAIEKVRNCTKINKKIVNEIVDLVANNLLSKVRIIETDSAGINWNAGGRIELSEIAQLIPSNTLKQLKKEYGGLQTLLKNNSHIFQVINGKVQFRIPVSDVEVIKKRRNKSNLQLRVKPCWFFMNHPNGCTLNAEKCNFKH